MKILKFNRANDKNTIHVTSTMQISEIKRLQGYLDGILVMAKSMLTEAAAGIQTGARSHYARYLLFPLALRKLFRADRFDFKNMLCGAFRFRDKLYVVYEIQCKVSENRSKGT